MSDVEIRAKKCMEEVDRELSAYSLILDEAEGRMEEVCGDHPFVVAFFGRFKTGKSSLVNALLGMDLLPTRATTATAVLTRVRYGHSLRTFVLENGNAREVSPEKAREVILYDQTKPYDNPPEVLFELPLPWLKGPVELWDTPGLHDGVSEGALEALTLQALRGADLGVIVYDAQSFISARERDITREAQRMLGGNLVFAVNRTNCLNTPEDLRRVESAVKNEFCNLGNEHVGEGRHYLMCSAPNMIDLDGFDTWLQGLMRKGGEKLRSWMRETAALSKIDHACEEVRAKANPLLENARTLTEAVRKDHLARIRIQRGKTKADSRDEAQTIKEFAAAAAARLENLEGIREELEKLLEKSGWVNTYAEDSKQVVLKAYTRLGVSLSAEFTKKVGRPPRPNLQVFSFANLELTFPGPRFTEGSKGWGWGALAAGVTFLVTANPVLAGAAGMAAKKASSSHTTNISVSNTLEFVRTNALPILKLYFDEQIKLEITEAAALVARADSDCRSGLEEVLKLLENTQERIIPFAQRGAEPFETLKSEGA